MGKEPPNRDSGNPWRQASLALSVPMLMAAGPLAGFLLGWGVNWFFKIQPPWDRRVMIIGVVVGTIAGIRETIVTIKKIGSDRS